MGYKAAMTPRVASKHALRAAVTGASLALLAACGGAGAPFERVVRQESAHERYARSLREADLDGTALGRDWLAAASAALAAAPPITTPYREAGYFAESEARAVAYRVKARRGQRIVARVQLEGSSPARLFIDLFEPPRDSAKGPIRLASADSGTAGVTYEAERDGEYLLRLQPELLRGARYLLTVRAEASLAFPVQGRDSRAVQSFFGAVRDAGRREHHGVDIFAPRGTPVLAAAAGIASAGTNELGGKVVWVRDPLLRRSLYYAHLDSQLVGTGQPVRVGDTLGLVGNSGNARTTRPHLHFGIYARGEGPVDPFPFINQPRGTLPPLAADTSALGGWRRVEARGGLELRRAPSERDSSLRTLPRRTVVHVDGAAGRYFRVRLPDGATGYLAASGTAVPTPHERVRRPAHALVRSEPTLMAAAIDSVAAGATVPVLGRFDRFLFVRMPSGRTGWLEAGD
jgi:murein DD-endopeptidase MepM/ murein hydrolase activator NlpD